MNLTCSVRQGTKSKGKRQTLTGGMWKLNDLKEREKGWGGRASKKDKSQYFSIWPFMKLFLNIKHAMLNLCSPCVPNEYVFLSSPLKCPFIPQNLPMQTRFILTRCHIQRNGRVLSKQWHISHTINSVFEEQNFDNFHTYSVPTSNFPVSPISR